MNDINLGRYVYDARRLIPPFNEHLQVAEKGKDRIS